MVQLCGPDPGPSPPSCFFVQQKHRWAKSTHRSLVKTKEPVEAHDSQPGLRGRRLPGRWEEEEDAAPALHLGPTLAAPPAASSADMRSAGKSWLLLGGFVLFYGVYLLFGALVFSSIERPVEDELRREVEALKRDFLNRSCVDAAALERFLGRVLAANKRGVSVLRNASLASNWDLASSMFFANTLVTTVGESSGSRGRGTEVCRGSDVGRRRALGD